MPVRPCPECGHVAPRWLDGPSKDAYVNYYRCDTCGHVFSVPKNDPDGPTRNVTVRTSTDRDSDDPRTGDH